MSIEDTIIQTLLTNKDYFGKVFSHLKTGHFSKIENAEIFSKIKEYYVQYQIFPPKKEVGLLLKDIKTEKLRSSVIEHFKYIMTDEKCYNLEFLIFETEKHVKNMEFIEAIQVGAEAIQKGKNLEPAYGKMGDALKIKFDTDLGLEFSNLERRLEYYKKKSFGLSTGIPSIDEILDGGIRPKTLNIIAGASHSGKSGMLNNFAAYQTLQGKNGLVFTLEMSEEEWAKRVDSNIFNIDINTFRSTPNNVFESAYNSVKHKLGKLIIKEFPAGTFDVLKMEACLNETQVELGIQIDYIVIDYLTLMKSVRLQPSVGPYSYYKSVAEEVHGFSKKHNMPIFTGSQLNRAGFNNKDAGMENVSDSIGIAQTADTFFIITRTKELDEMGQVAISFSKNRNSGNMSKTIIGFDSSHMRFLDLGREIESTNQTLDDLGSPMFDW